MPSQLLECDWARALDTARLRNQWTYLTLTGRSQLLECDWVYGSAIYGRKRRALRCTVRCPARALPRATWAGTAQWIPACAMGLVMLGGTRPLQTHSKAPLSCCACWPRFCRRPGARTAPPPFTCAFGYAQPAPRPRMRDRTYAVRPARRPDARICA